MTKNRKKVVFFLPSLEGGGAEKNTVNLLKNIDQIEYDASLVLAEKRGDFIKLLPKWIQIYNLETKSKAYFKIFLKLIKYFKKENPDILVSAFPHFNIICILARKISKSKTKLVITEHVGLLSLPDISSSFFNSLISKFILPILVKIFYKEADAIVCVSKGVAEDLRKIIGKNLNFTIIHNPINEKEIKLMGEEKVEHKWFASPEIPVAIMVGRLIKQKDYHTALMSLALVNKKKDLKMIILGRGSEEKNLRDFSKKLGLSKNVEFLGFQSNPYKYMSKSSVFILSSIKEGFGNVIVEAMASGVPVVSTNCPVGPDEIINNDKNGILVPVKNPELLANAILKILSNTSFKNNLISQGKVRAEDFSVKKIANKYEEVINKL